VHKVSKKAEPRVRWFCPECKKSLSFELTEEFKKKFTEIAGNFYPYPMIIAHKDHYTIIHLDKQFQDRGSIVTKIFMNLTEKSDKK
jgi:hypothetical protein